MKTIEQAFREELQYLEGRYNGEIRSMRTPWPMINQMNIDGTEWGTISTLAGMSGVGKTAFINQLITEVHDVNPHDEIAILFFTMEMAARRIVGRTISNQTGKSIRQMYLKSTQQEIEHIRKHVMPKFIKRDITYVEYMQSPENTRRTIENFIETRSKKKVLVVYDHSLLISKIPGFTERDTLVELVGIFNELKKTYPNSQYWIASQLNRDIEKVERVRNASTHFPTKGDIFGSEALYQFSDFVCVLHNPHKLGITAYGPSKWVTKGYIFAHLLKLRDSRPNQTVVFRDTLANNRLLELTKEELINYGFK